MKNRFLKLILSGLVLVTTGTHLASCGPVANIAKDIFVGVMVECTVRDCTGKSSNASPEQSLMKVVNDYYTLINQRKYETAWEYLSPNFKARMEAKGRETGSTGYKIYSEWWSGFKGVTINKLALTKGAENQVYVDAQLNYFAKDNKDFSHVLRLTFIWDKERNGWAIDSSQVIPSL